MNGWNNELKEYIRQFIAKAMPDIQDTRKIEVPKSLKDTGKEKQIWFKTGFGEGRPTNTPWLACLRTGQQASYMGAYPVIIYSRQTELLSICYGISQTNNVPQRQINWPIEWPNSLLQDCDPQETFPGTYIKKGFDTNIINIDSIINDISETFNYLIDKFLEIPITHESKNFSLTRKSNHSTNNILYGPPGTGKTYSLTALCLQLVESNYIEDNNLSPIIQSQAHNPITDDTYKTWSNEFSKHLQQGRIEFTTFHQNYSYEDFVEGLKANLVGTTVHYKIESGILKRIAYRALYAWLTGKEAGFELYDEQIAKVNNYLAGAIENNNKPASIPSYVLIIDEINRGNVARIFGELITLIEESKRACREITPGSQPVFATLPYSKERFILPPNLHIIGTMNTADRSLIGLDAALRRRFNFIELIPRPELLSTDVDGINLSNFLSTLNQRIEEKDTRDHCIGHAYFIAASDFADIQEVMRRKVIPQLQEYFHDRPTELKKFLTVGERSFVNDKGIIDSVAIGDRDMYTGFASQ